ncbi:MAG: hypothetical protein REH83_00610 [Rickettsiella sp.]|nr:hypothetical protein [Rickettsiella sp.]
MTIFLIDNENKNFVRLISNCKLKTGKSIPKNKTQYKFAMDWVNSSSRNIEKQLEKIYQFGIETLANQAYNKLTKQFGKKSTSLV